MGTVLLMVLLAALFVLAGLAAIYQPTKIRSEHMDWCETCALKGIEHRIPKEYPHDRDQ